MTTKTKTVLIVIVGLILVGVGVLASSFLIQRFRSDQGVAVTEELTVKSSVVIVTRDLLLGDTIARSDVELISVPVELAPRTALTSPEEAVGKIIKTDLVQGQMLLSHNLADPTNRINDLSFILSDDHVLLAFPGEDLMSVESMVMRGDIIDIFASFVEEVKTVGETTTTTGETIEPEMRTFTVNTMQKVSVTAMVLEIIDQESESSLPQDENSLSAVAPRPRIRAYLLALKPQDALILKHLKDTGAIFDIVLRAPTSTIQFNLTPVSKEYIIEYYGLEILP